MDSFRERQSCQHPTFSAAPDVSIIVLIWNAKDLAVQCISSILAHTTRYSIEVIAVDNASTDGVDSLIANQFPQVHLIRNDRNLGFAAGNNVGIKHSTGRYICLLNSDTELLPGCLDNLVSFMEAHPKVGLSSPQGLNPDRTLRKSCKTFPSLWNQLCDALCFNRIFPQSRLFGGRHMDYFSHLHNKIVDVLPGSFWIVNRAAFMAVGYLDERFFFYGEDLDWCKRFHKMGWELYFCAQAQFLHHHKGSSRKDPVFFHVQQYRSALLYWRKHHGKTTVAIVRSLMLFQEVSRLFANVFIYLLKQDQRNKQTLRIQCIYKAICFLMGNHNSEQMIKPQSNAYHS